MSKPVKQKLQPGMKMWLSSTDSKGVFGDGKWRLLGAIERTGSLKAACEVLGISYRKAWGDLKKAQTFLGTTFLEKHRGGAGGGNTLLTPQGRKWLKAYSKFRRDVERAVERSYKKHIMEQCQ